MELQVVGKGSMGEDKTQGQWSNGSKCLERFVELWGGFGFKTTPSVVLTVIRRGIWNNLMLLRHALITN